MDNLFNFSFIGILVYVVILIFSIIIHEVSHGFVAERLGDPTARLAGRLTLNPLPHIDLVGSIILPLLLLLSQTGIMFGWAKPVPVDSFNFKNPRRDMAIVSFAGPATNLLLAFITSIILKILLFSHIDTLFLDVLAAIVTTNLALALFNLLPIFPLDGFKVIAGLLPREKAVEWAQLERYGTIFLLVLILPIIGGQSMISLVISPILHFLESILI